MVLASLSMLTMSAEANTSAGAPFWIWVTNVADPAKFSVTLTPRLARSKSLAMSVNAALNDAAANTVSEPVTGAGLVVDVG